MRFHDLLKEQAYPNCNQVAKEFEVSWRTIMRDVDFMKCRLNLPMEFDQQRNGYYYTKPVEQFPHLPLSESEVFALLVAHKAIAQYRGTPFEQPSSCQTKIDRQPAATLLRSGRLNRRAGERRRQCPPRSHSALGIHAIPKPRRSRNGIP